MNSANHQNFEALQEQIMGINYRFDSLTRTLTEIKTGLGMNLEQLAAEFLKHLLKDRGILEPKVKTNYILQVPSANTYREIDVYCEEPRIIIECTSFLSKNKSNKLQRFLETRNYLESDGKECSETFFICYGIQPDILEESLSFMEKHNIKLLNGNGLLK